MNLYVVVLGIIVVTLLGVSLARLGKVKTKADYLVAGRSLPAFVLVFTLLSSWIGSGSLLGGAENAYKHGFAALWQSAGGWAGLALIYFIAPRARKFAQFTIPDLLESRYNQTARVLGVIAVLFAYTAITSYQFIGGGDILHLIFPQVTAVQGQYILAGFVIVFTAIAGMGSVAYMDVVIGLLATFTMLAALPVLIHLAGGWSNVHAVLPASHFKVFGDIHPFQSYFIGPVRADGSREKVQSALAIFLPTCLLMLGNQSMYQKFFSAKSEKDATRATIGWVIGTVILETVIVAIAVVGSALYPTGEVHDRPREILAYTAVHGFGGSKVLSILGALLVGAIFAKVVSTANNYLFSPATNLVNDVFVRYIKAGCRQQVGPSGFALDGRSSRTLGVVAIAGDQLCAGKIGLRLHHLCSSDYPGSARRILLAPGHSFSSGRQHRGGRGGHDRMGYDLTASAPDHRRAGRHSSRAAGLVAVPVCGQSADPSAKRGEAGAVRCITSASGSDVSRRRRHRPHRDADQSSAALQREIALQAAGFRIAGRFHRKLVQVSAGRMDAVCHPLAPTGDHLEQRARPAADLGKRRTTVIVGGREGVRHRAGGNMVLPQLLDPRRRQALARRVFDQHLVSWHQNDVAGHANPESKHKTAQPGKIVLPAHT